MSETLRKNVGSIVSSIGLVLLVILTYGNLGELFTDGYWQNVGGNLSSISALTIGLVMVQVTIKQGVSEQALSKGLNTKNTKDKYDVHKDIVKKCQDRFIFLPYFLSLRNERETKRRKREFLVENNFKSETGLRESGNKKLIKAYDQIQTNITVDSIKWSTTEIVYNKNGRIEKLETYRKKRAVKAIITGFAFMFATTLIAGGLFLDKHDIPWWQKTIKLFTYLVTMAMSVIFDVGKNYEKGAFGVPNELDEINSIWDEFDKWKVPDWVLKEVKNENLTNIDTLDNQLEEPLLILDTFAGKSLVQEEKENEIRESEEIIDTGTDLQKESEEIQTI